MTSQIIDDPVILFVVIALFIVTSIISGFVTFKLRMKKNRKNLPDNKDNDKNS